MSNIEDHTIGCAYCGNRGMDQSGNICPVCNGSGKNVLNSDPDDLESCSFCGGRGYDQFSNVCPSCGGIGLKKPSFKKVN